MKIPNRNEVCWCGSGRKYKKCHLNRESQKKPDIWEIEASSRKLHETKTCLHPLAGPATCRPPMVRAHTVRRSADLKAIARKGHVYRGNAEIRTLDETGGRIIPKLIGINSASTFWGFCQAHDTSTFAPLEKRAIEPTDEQAFLLAYRPLAMELYLKQRQLEGLALMREADKGWSLEDQISFQADVLLMEAGAKSAIADLQDHKSEFDRALLASDFSMIRFVTFHLDRAPEIMCSGVVQPQYTFSGEVIQNLDDLSRTSRFISFSLISTDTGGAGVFAWPLDSDSEASMLVDSLLALPEGEIPAALVRFSLSNFENVFFSPGWWENLPKRVSDSLISRLNHAVGSSATDPLALRDDGVRPVAWKIVSIQQKRV